MKTFFTIFAGLFLGIVTIIMIAGYVNRNNRITKETYIQKIQGSIGQ